MTRLRTITVVVRENDTPCPPVAPWPLLYTVEVPVGPIDDSALLRQIADIRVDELGLPDEQDGTQNEKVYEILAGLELLFAFESAPYLTKDWRG